MNEICELIFGGRNHDKLSQEEDVYASSLIIFNSFQSRCDSVLSLAKEGIILLETIKIDGYKANKLTKLEECLTAINKLQLSLEAVDKNDHELLCFVTDYVEEVVDESLTNWETVTNDCMRLVDGKIVL